VSPKAAELHATCFSRSERSFRAPADTTPLLLGNSGLNVQPESVSAGHVRGDETNVRLHEPSDKRNVTREAVKLGDEKHGPRATAGVHSGHELRPRVVLAALNLSEALQLVVIGAKETPHGLLLRFKAKA